jgi:hypothetical protein
MNAVVVGSLRKEDAPQLLCVPVVLEMYLLGCHETPTSVQNDQKFIKEKGNNFGN